MTGNDIEALILRALVRKLIVKGVLRQTRFEPCCSMPQKVSTCSAAI
jgi:hypothetical protein